MIYFLVLCTVFTDERAGYSSCKPDISAMTFRTEEACHARIKSLDLHRVWESDTMYLDYKCGKAPTWSLADGEQ